MKLISAIAVVGLLSGCEDVEETLEVEPSKPTGVLVADEYSFKNVLCNGENSNNFTITDSGFTCIASGVVLATFPAAPDRSQNTRYELREANEFTEQNNPTRAYDNAITLIEALTPNDVGSVYIMPTENSKAGKDFSDTYREDNLALSADEFQKLVDALNKVVDNPGDKDLLEKYSDINKVAGRYGLYNISKGLKASFQTKVNDINNGDYVGGVPVLNLTDYNIDFNKESRDIMAGGVSGDTITLNSRRWRNFPDGLNSVNILNIWSGLSIGYIDSKIAPESDSRVLTLRWPGYIPWDNTDTEADHIFSNAVKVFSENKPSYVIHQSSDLDEKLTQYQLDNELDFEITADEFNINTMDAYYSYGMNETAEQCSLVRGYIEQGADLIVYHDNTTSMDQYCMDEVVKEYYGLEINQSFRTPADTFALKLASSPYTYEKGEAATPDDSDPILGNAYDGEKFNPNRVMNADEHRYMVSFFSSLSKVIENQSLTDLVKSFESAYAENNIDLYFDALARMNEIIEDEVDPIEFNLPELTITDNRRVKVSGNNLPVSMYVFSLNAGQTFNTLYTDEFKVNNEPYLIGDIIVKLNDRYATYLGYSDNTEVVLNAEIAYDPDLVEQFDPLNPVYISQDGNHILYTGRMDGRGWDLVITGDGFLERDRDLFDKYVISAINNFFKYENIGPHFGMYNIHSVFVPSNERGADWSIEIGCDDETYDNCTTAKNAPSNSIEDKNPKDTVFDAGFFVRGANTMARGLSVDGNVVKARISPYVPQYDDLMAIVHTNVYGGLGGGMSTANKGNNDVFVHEIGHSFAGLHDEYNYGGGGTDTCNNNICNVFENMPWKHHLEPDATIDTVCTEEKTDNDPDKVCPIGTVGWFEGGKYVPEGLFRPTMNSIMMANGLPFYAVNAELWAKAVYNRTGFFVITAPFKESLNVYDRALTYPDQADQTFGFVPTNEIGYDIENAPSRVQTFKWYINDVHVTELDNQLEITYGAGETGSYTVELRSKDISDLIVSETMLDKYRTFTWSVSNNAVARTFSDPIAEDKTSLRIDMRVSQNRITLVNKTTITQEMSGNTCATDVFQGVNLELRSKDGAIYNYCPTNAAYTHEGNALTTKAFESTDTDAQFDIVITPEMNGKKYDVFYKYGNDIVKSIPTFKLDLSK